jgi:uncharacterized protein YeaO (DUF488 family)
MPFRTDKHCRMAPDPEDGLRVLTMRYWPRGVRRDSVHIYAPQLAPSVRLLRRFRELDRIPAIEITATAREEQWQRLMEEFRAEMRLQRESMDELFRRHLTGETISLLCGCHDPLRCHRTVLALLIQNQDSF